MGNRDKLGKVFGEGAFGQTDVPTTIGNGQLARAKKALWAGTSRDDHRSWKRRRRTRWRK
jgi:hypothetical protein